LVKTKFWKKLGIYGTRTGAREIFWRGGSPSRKYCVPKEKIEDPLRGGFTDEK